jgi:hypothetical protein
VRFVEHCIDWFLKDVLQSRAQPDACSVEHCYSSWVIALARILPSCTWAHP